MNEQEFWGRGMEDDRPDETRIQQQDREEFQAHDSLRCPPKLIPGKGLPDNNPKTAFGIKKVPTHSRIPWTAVILEGIVMALGGIKYGPFNWRQNSVAASVYVDAMERHISLWNAGEDDDDESLVSHLAHVRACCGILIDAIETGNLVDDRPKNETVIRLMKESYNVEYATPKS